MKRAASLTRLLKELVHRDASRRRSAAESLADADVRAVYPLIEALRDASPGVQDAAMRSLIAIGGESTAYMVIPLLRDDSYLRNTAIIILKGIGGPAVPLLYPLLKDKDDDVRKFALDLLIDINQGIDHEKILPLLKDQNQNVRASAVKAAGAVMGHAAVPLLIEALMDDEWVVFSALETLSIIRDASAVAPVIVLLENPSAALRVAAIEALGRIGSPDAVEPLISFFSVADDMEKREVVKSLVEIGALPFRPEILGIARAMLKDGDWDERMVALRGLVSLKEEKAIPEIVDIGGGLDPSLPESGERLFRIREALQEFGCSDYLLSCIEDPSVRYRGKLLAVDVVAELQCRKAAPSLLRLIGGPASSTADQQTQGNPLESFVVRKAVIEALGRIGDGSAFGPLWDFLFWEQNQELREEVMRTLITLDQAAVISRREVFQDSLRELFARHLCDERTLIELTGDTNRDARLAALLRLGRVGSEAAMTRLKEVMKDPDPALRKAAIHSLGELRCYCDELRDAAVDTDMSVRLSAVKALGESEEPAVTDVLKPLLSDKEVAVVLAAIEALARIGGREAVNALATLEEHEDPLIREMTIQAIERI